MASALRHALASICWALPWRFSIANALGWRYGLRCVVFHEVASEASPLTRGLNVTVSPEQFEAQIRFFVRHYNPVSLDRVLSARDPGDLPDRALLVTFDDAYASVARVAGPILARHRVPSAFFVNARFVGNGELALDNLLCYVHNTAGLGVIFDAVEEVAGAGATSALQSLDDIIMRFTSTLDPAATDAFGACVARHAGIRPTDVAAEMRPYLEETDVRNLASVGVEVGNHTFSHAWCRTLLGESLMREVSLNAVRLRELGAGPIRSFAVPYGSPADLTPGLSSLLSREGCDAVFVVRGKPNPRKLILGCLERVCLSGSSDSEMFLDLEILPRLRVLRSVYRTDAAHAY